MIIIFWGRHYDDDNLWEEDNKSKMEVFGEEMLWNEPIVLIWFSVFSECAINEPILTCAAASRDKLTVNKFGKRYVKANKDV